MKLKRIKGVYNTYITTSALRPFGILIPKNTVCVRDGYDIWYFCKHFPRRYDGDIKNLQLFVTWVDTHDMTIGKDYVSGDIAQSLYFGWLACSKPHTEKPQPHYNYASMMQDCIRKPKKGGSGRRIMPHAENDVQDLRYNERTEEAHWEFSGACSMVANAMRYND